MQINITSSPYCGSYNIHIGEYFSNGEKLSHILSDFVDSSNHHIVIYDKKLKDIYLPHLIKVLNGLNLSFSLIGVKALESNKSFTTAHKIVKKALKYNVNRKSCIISLGGGIITDIAGFVASITLRGIKHISIPTTLLSMCDSAIGGKTGVNSKSYGKNLIGSFFAPSCVIIDYTTLKSLPKRDLISGFAEVIKYSLIYQNKTKDDLQSRFFNYLEQNCHLLLHQDPLFLQNIIATSCNIKKALVENDERETSQQRVLLNFGHTFGHALEKLNNYKKSLLHGEAVAIGMAIASYISMQMDLIPKANLNRIISLLHNAGLNTTVNKKFTATNIVNAMKNDKKNYNNLFNLILLNNIGEAKVYSELSAKELLNFVQSYKSTQ